MLPVREKVAHTPLRIKFAKTGDLQYISHLDLHRTFSRMLVRAGIPVWYSEGFSPHPRLVFATPLSVGAESLCEYLDVSVIGTPETIDATEMHMKLYNSGIPGLQILNVYLPETKFASITDSDYTINLFLDNASDALAEDCVRTLTAKPLTVLKRTKSGDRDVDISPLIRTVEGRYNGECIILKVRLAADNANFLNPEYLIGALRDRCGVLSGDPAREEYSILRTAVLADGKPFK